MPDDDMNAVAEQINAGAQIAPIDPLLIEHVWDAVSRIPKDTRQHNSLPLGWFARVNPEVEPRTSEQYVALMVRYALLDGLIEQHVLDDYMHDESLRKKVFAAAASMPCDKNDLAEAAATRILRDRAPEEAEKTKEEMRQAGCDPDHPKVGDKFLASMRDNS